MNSTPNQSPNPASSPKLFGLRPEPSSLFNRASVTTIALVNAIVLAGSADAQTPATEDANKTSAAKKNSASGTQTVEVTLDEIVVAAQPETYKREFLESPKYTAPILDTPQTINVVPQEVIKDQNATTLRDVLRNVPGIAVQAGEGGVPNGDILTIRGFSARNDMFVDGVRDIGGYTRDPFNYEQVEVAKGSSSSFTGRGSVGGSVNLVTKKPNLEQSYAGSVGIGTDQYVRLTLDANQPIPTIAGAAFRLNVLFQEADTPGRNYTNSKRWGIAPSLAFGLDGPTRLTLNYMHLQQDNMPDNGIPWVPATNIPLSGRADRPATDDYRTWYGLVKRDYEEVKTDIITVEVEHDINDDLTLRNVFRYGRNDRDAIYTAPRLNSNNTTDIRRDPKFHDRVTEIFSDSLSLRAKFDTWKFSHTADVGVEYSHEREFSRSRAAVPGQTGPLAPVENPNAHDRPPSYGSASSYTGAINDTKTDSVGIFFFDTIKLHEQLELTGGARWEHFSVDHRGISSDDTGNIVTPLSHSDDFVSWRIGPVYKPVDYGSIYVSYGTSFSPSAEGLGVGLNANNVALKPEEARTFEIGTKWDLLDRRLSVTGAIFRTDKINARTPSLDPSDPQLVLEGEQRVDGLELGVNGSITPEWKVYGGFSYLNSKTLKSNTPEEVGRRLPNTPQTTFSLWTTYDLPWNITIGGGAQYVGSRFNNASNQRKGEEYWVFDAMLAYKISENMNAQFNITNIADERYLDRLGNGHVVPGVGRAATLTLNFKF